MNPISNTHTEVIDCSICLESDTEDKTTLMCRHIFHTVCLELCIDLRTCPLCFRQVEILDPRSCKWLIFNAKVYLSRMDFPKAFEAISAAQRLEPNNVHVALIAERVTEALIGEAYDIFLINKPRGIEFVNTLLQADPTNIELNKVRMEMLFCSGAIAESLQEALIKRVYDIFVINKPRGIGLINVLLELDPANIALKTVRAELFFYSESFQSALQELDSIIDLNPQNHEAWNFRGSIFYHQNKLEEALYSFYKCIKLIGPSGEGAGKYFDIRQKLIQRQVATFTVEDTTFCRRGNHFFISEKIDEDVELRWHA